jgi:hypothetical protein
LSKRYKSEDYFSVIETKTGRKICDCGEEEDALMMVSFDPNNRTITRNNFLMGQVVDIEIPKQLPTNEVVHIPIETEPFKQHQEEWMVDKIKKLNQSDLKEFTGE